MRLTLALPLFGTFVLAALGCQVDEQAPDATVVCLSTEQDAPYVVTDAARAELDRLVSTDADVRRAALAELALEFSSGPTRSEGKYTNYGDALLPVLHQVILELNDPYAHDAIEALFRMGTIDQLRSELGLLEADDVSREELLQEFQKVCHYPVPSDHLPLKEALINVLNNSTDAEAKYWAALALVDGFKPVSEIEDVLTTRLPLEEPNARVQSAILGSLSEIADGSGVKRTTELQIIEALASPNEATRRAALQIVKRHKYDGAIDGLIRSMSSARSAYEFSQKFGAMSTLGPFDEAQIAELQVTLEEWAAGIDHEQTREIVTRDVSAMIQTMKYALTDTEHRFGLVRVDGSSILLHTAHRGLMPGTHAAVVGSGTVLVVATKADAERDASVTIGSHPIASYYLGTKSNTLNPELVENRIAYVSTDSPDFPVSSLEHSNCTSNEGIHHSVWSTGDSGRTRVWSAYQYLGYDVEPSCSDDELSE